MRLILKSKNIPDISKEYGDLSLLIGFLSSVVKRRILF